MDSTTNNFISTGPPGAAGITTPIAPIAPVEPGLSEISSLLRSLDESAANSGRARPKAARQENQLAQVRLGMASSLFTALRCKHAPTAAHSMRVALGCSAWTLAMELSGDERDQIEAAALLHDVGKIGVPDHLLQKPGKLTADETAVMDHHHQLGLDILGCCAPQDLLDAVRYAPAWYDGSTPGIAVAGQDLPLGARVIAIVDAFDAMTTDHVYRRALSRERALMELYEYAGHQFDPDLVRTFAELHEQNHLDLDAKVSQRWLESLAPELANQQWRLSSPAPNSDQTTAQSLFQQKLLDHMHDGVVFVDGQRRIVLWNHGAERLSGIGAEAVYQRNWLPGLLRLRDERGKNIADVNCPIAKAIRTGVQSMQRMSIKGRNGAEVHVDLHAIPVTGRDGATYGATVMLHDVSSEASLEERCESLHSQATKDPLTQVANRAEFDRVHELFLQAHHESNLPCSLIICDIDHFKLVNDTYGHQAGDEAIKSFAALMKSLGRQGDLVARYGGEEFVMLCADCSNAAAQVRAEKIRHDLSELPMALMGNRRITASFGVTENQPGDTPETMLRRADRALLEAKASGRNRVVQLGAGSQMQQERRQSGWWPFANRPAPDVLVEARLATSVSMELAIEKLRGFLADHDAHVISTDDDCIELSIEASWLSLLRRSNDRPVALRVELHFSQLILNNDARCERPPGTRVYAIVRPKRSRDRRLALAQEQARQLVSSLKSYLMAQEAPAEEVDVVSRAKKVLAPWLGK